MPAFNPDRADAETGDAGPEIIITRLPQEFRGWAPSQIECISGGFSYTATWKNAGQSYSMTGLTLDQVQSLCKLPSVPPGDSKR